MVWFKGFLAVLLRVGAIVMLTISIIILRSSSVAAKRINFFCRVMRLTGKGKSEGCCFIVKSNSGDADRTDKLDFTPVFVSSNN